MTLHNIKENTGAIIYNVYGPNHYMDKAIYWDALKNYIDKEDSNNIIIGGDFNLILHANEKRGGCFSPDHSKELLEIIIQDHELVDIIPKIRNTLGVIAD